MTVRAAFLAGTLALAGLLAAAGGCTSGPESPQALFEEFQRRHTEGDFGGTWTLLSREGQRRWTEGIETNRETLRRNPRNPAISRQYFVTEEEFKTLPPGELWKRTSSCTQRALLGAKVVQEAPAPGEPGVVQLDVELPSGQKYRWFVQEEEDRGWRFRDTMPLVLEPDRRPEQ